MSQVWCPLPLRAAERRSPVTLFTTPSGTNRLTAGLGERAAEHTAGPSPPQPRSGEPLRCKCAWCRYYPIVALVSPMDGLLLPSSLNRNARRERTRHTHSGVDAAMAPGLRLQACWPRWCLPSESRRMALRCEGLAGLVRPPAKSISASRLLTCYDGAQRHTGADLSSP
jgi:hypothetical protein